MHSRATGERRYRGRRCCNRILCSDHIDYQILRQSRKRKIHGRIATLFQASFFHATTRMQLAAVANRRHLRTANQHRMIQLAIVSRDWISATQREIKQSMQRLSWHTEIARGSRRIGDMLFSRLAVSDAQLFDALYANGFYLTVRPIDKHETTCTPEAKQKKPRPVD